MIVYEATKREFIIDVLSNYIDDQITAAMVRETGHGVSGAERRAWRNSMLYMKNIIEDADIPEDAGIAIEYIIPHTAKRIDFIITGYDQFKNKKAVVVELKQWESVKSVSSTDMDAVMVQTFVGGAVREVLHPSYQVYSYVVYLQDYHTEIQEGKIQLHPCAYLHNYDPDQEIVAPQYKKYIEKAPLFFRTDSQKLSEFIKEHVKYGDNKEILYEIENGKIKPSKFLADALPSILAGNKEFTLLDEQKLVYEKALDLTDKANEQNKWVLIVKGGPGTGKSVVAVNLLAELTKRRKLVKYVTKNAAPREVFIRKLSESNVLSQARIRNLMVGSGSFYSTEPNTFDALIVDEAHRLNEKSGLFNNLGVNQVKEIINAAKCAVFFIDEDQRVTLKDIGSVDEIKKWAEFFNAGIVEMELVSQFRCNGSDGYLAWLDNTLQIRETANFDLSDIDYDFRVFDSPQELHNKIIELNKENNKSRVVAGYTWNWVTNRPENAHLYDIQIGDYKARWNLTKHGQAWIIHPESVFEVGCIHTCQGLELDYVGVIIGPDLIVRNNKVITDFRKRARTDQSLRGIMKIVREKGEEYAQKLAEPIIKNTYRTLMSRGMKGCFIYSEDEETREYFRNAIDRSNQKYFD